jgi:signal transduction histidine kinase
MVGALVLVLVLALAWIRTLRHQVGERTKLLKKEIEEHKITERQLAEESRRVQAEIEEHRRTETRLEEKTGLLEQEIAERRRAQAEVERVQRELMMASRLAGMAEVATGLLHNVGNVLNSVNVLASLMVSHVRKSKVSSVSKLAALLGGHRHDLAGFLTEDAAGRQIPGYLERLASHLAEEQSLLLEKVKTITDNVQHIKEIVAMQQSYARIAGVREQISLQEIVEDSLRMHREAMERHGISILKEFEPVPAVTVDRNKILQILFNLLANAKDACEASGRLPRQVTVRICQVNGFVQVSVADNGEGVSAENLPRIFTQGFTTRASGHGFGLHSSILALQEMGGALEVQSAGPGQGATFTLKVPLLVNPAFPPPVFQAPNGGASPGRNN